MTGHNGRQLARVTFPFWIPAEDSLGNALHACGIVGLMFDSQAAHIIQHEYQRAATH